MLGAIIGDIVGSRFEWNNCRNKDFELFSPECFATDDSIMTLAVGEAIAGCDGHWRDLGEACEKAMRSIGRRYPDSGYGGRFNEWICGRISGPYASFGNGAAMRVSACAWAAQSLSEAISLSGKVTAVTHNHPEGLRGAEAVTAAIWLAREGADKDAIRAHIERNYYSLFFTLDQIRQTYRFNETCQRTVPQALEAFLEADSFEDAIRNAISVGGDSDTLAAITGSVAHAYWGIPDAIRVTALTYLDAFELDILERFEMRYPHCAGAH